MDSDAEIHNIKTERLNFFYKCTVHRIFPIESEIRTYIYALSNQARHVNH